MRKVINDFFLFVLVVMPIYAFSFNFSVNVTNESCPGNGSLEFVVTATNPGSTIHFIVYKLPETSTPYASLSGNILQGVSAGSYNIIAQEVVGATTTSQQITVEVLNNVIPLVYEVQSFNQACSSVSSIQINTISGSPVSYEIFEGPVIFPSQSSSLFSNLPPGIYKIRVFDSCGSAVVTTFTVTDNAAGLLLLNPVLSSPVNASCTSIEVNNTIVPFQGTVIAYPIQVVYTADPSGSGTPIVISNSYPTGNLFSLPISAVLPQYINQSYSYQISITDNCGVEYNFTNTINSSISVFYNILHLPCSENYFKIQVGNFTPPFNIHFLSAPDGFVPSTFNPLSPGPFTDNVITFGGETQPVPIGEYTFMVVDSCGRTKLVNFSIIDALPIPLVVGSNNSCITDSGTISITIPDSDITAAVVLNAPPNYANTLPHDISSMINGGNILLSPVPTGNYSILLTEYCSGTTFPVDVTVPEYTNRGLASETLPGCEINKGSLSIKSNNAKLTLVNLVAAPVGFSSNLPLNVSENIIATGVFYLNDLPSGSYTFNCVDECNYTNTITIEVNGYQISVDDFSLVANCGSFDIPLYFTSNATNAQSFWLQKMISPNVWGNPLTNTIYPEGTVPNVSNSIQLANNSVNYNFMFNGIFRIVRRFVSFNNGNDYNDGIVPAIGKNCIEILTPTMSFNEALEIVNANRMPCNTDGNLDVVLACIGHGTLHYSIINKDGVPFVIDNGNSNIFYGLPNGVYTFQVEDTCGNIVTKIFDVTNLSPFINIAQPNSILNCTEFITGNETFDFSGYSASIIGNQNPDDFTITFHDDLDEAQTGVNPITNTSGFNPSSNNQTVFVRVVYNPIPDCYSLTSFDLIVGQIPQLSMQEEYINCSNSPMSVTIEGNNLPTTTYVWSDGSTGTSIIVDQEGITEVSVTATNDYGDAGICSITKQFKVINSVNPVVDKVITVDWTPNENSIEVLTSNVGHFEYSLDGFDFQPENIFNNLNPGLYTVYVRDVYGCGLSEIKVWLLYYKRYFTPNEDGYNDWWRIENSENEPDFKVFIFDRFGKFLTSFLSRDSGWNGTYNNSKIISDDYWFVVHRQDGRIHRGHFSLKR